MSMSAAEDGGPEGILNAILASYLERNDRTPIVREQFLGAHPEQAAELRQFFADEDQVDGLIGGSEGEPADSEADSRPGAAIAPPGLLTAGATFRDYEVLETLGQGGMGVVYKTRQKRLDRIVAVKMIRPSRHGDADEVQRFYGEAKAVGQFQHPHIVGVHEVGEYDGHPFFSMDFVEGQSLAKMISQNPLPQRQAAVYVQKIAAAMQYAHDRGVLHRDIKPANILIDQHDEPRITDFGLAKRVDCDSKLTATGTPMGTPSYMPPEQARGTWSEVGPRSDVYALGATLYDLLVGRPPFKAPTWSELLLQVLNHEPVSPREFNATIARDLETICLKCLQKRSADRYASARELADDLARFLRNEPIQARPVSVAERSWRWGRRNRLAVVAIVSLALGLVVAMIGYGKAVQSRREADASFQDALEAVNDMFTIVAEEKSINQPGLKPFRKVMLERARDYYQRFNERRPKSAQVGLEYAKNRYRLARVLQELASMKDARSEYESAAQELRGLQQADPGNQEILEAIGTAFNDFGILLFQQKEFANSDACYEQAEEARRKLAKADPDKAVVLANTIMNRASVKLALSAAASGSERKKELRSQAMQGMKEAQRIRQGLLQTKPSDLQLQHDLRGVLQLGEPAQNVRSAGRASGGRRPTSASPGAVPKADATNRRPRGSGFRFH